MPAIDCVIAAPGWLPRVQSADASRDTRDVSWRTDLVAAAVLLALAVVATWIAAADATTYIRGDFPTIFFPWYSYLGDRLRQLAVPGWNPYQFSGAPFAGDPQAGWGYVPVMLLYALFPAEAATSLFVAFHLACPAIATYALARLLWFGPGGAFVAGAAYAFPWCFLAIQSQVVSVQLAAFLPVALVGLELALQARTSGQRFAGIALAGFAISQALAGWLGQGAYYALLITGGWIAWRTLVTPPAGWSLRDRFTHLIGVGGAVFLLGIAWDAAALLIRLDVNSRSTLAGGVYTGASRWTDAQAGWDLSAVVQSIGGGFTNGKWYYAGAAVLVLALLALVVARRWPPLLFWLAVAVVSVVLALPPQTPVHAVMYAILPYFETFHGHTPDRVLVVLHLPAALLAGATVDALSRSPVMLGRWRVAAVVAIAAVAGLAVALYRQDVVSRASLGAALAALAICTVASVLPVWRRALLVPLVLSAIVLSDPVGRILTAGWGPSLGPDHSLHAALDGEVEAFLHDNGAAAFLAAATAEEPGRYAGYDPALLPDAAAASDLPPQGYRNHWQGPSNWLLVTNWATWFGIDDIQGHNPAQIRRYAEYIDALNGHRQEYHDLNLYPGSFASPLLDPLNLRFLILPADAAARPDLAPLTERFPTVYTDEHVRIVENPSAFPRAWLVHDARQVPAGEALPLLTRGAVDPRHTALLEAPPPLLVPSPAGTAERAVYRSETPERIVVDVTAGSPALLVLSDIWDPGWTATVDGVPTPIFLADHTFRAIPVPAGTHTVELRYDPLSLRLGIAISLATTALVIAIGLLLFARARRWPILPRRLQQ